MERYLTTVSCSHEGDIIESLLAQAGISVLRKCRRSDSYMKILGAPGVAEEFYVRADDLERANQLLAGSENIENTRDNIPEAGPHTTGWRGIISAIVVTFIRLWLILTFGAIIFIFVSLMRGR